MNTKQQAAALAKLNTKPAKGVKPADVDSTPIHLSVAMVLGSVPSKAIELTESTRTNVKSFFGAMATSYKYNEAKRKGLI